MSYSVKNETGMVWLTIEDPGGTKTFIFDPARARAIANGMIKEADRAEGRPENKCDNCGIIEVYSGEDGWHCIGCGMTRKKALKLAQALVAEGQGDLDV
jgi:hypothetical protein